MLVMGVVYCMAGIVCQAMAQRCDHITAVGGLAAVGQRVFGWHWEILLSCVGYTNDW